MEHTPTWCSACFNPPLFLYVIAHYVTRPNSLVKWIWSVHGVKHSLTNLNYILINKNSKYGLYSILYWHNIEKFLYLRNNFLLYFVLGTIAFRFNLLYASLMCLGWIGTESLQCSATSQAKKQKYSIK